MDSLWSGTCKIEERPSLEGNIEAEIAVIGGGMTGILTAYQLQKEGKHVIVLDAGRIGSGQTRNTTAKITSQHGIIYEKMIKNYGEAKAKQYAMANETAILEYENLIERENISCDFQRESAYVYARSSSDLQGEAEAAKRLGLPAALVREGLSLPFPVWGAVKFQNQAQFHPLKFLKGISSNLNIYENTPVLRAEGHIIDTLHGKVKAEKIIFACHYPFLNLPGLYLTRMHEERSYVLALENAAKMNGMYIGSSKSDYSFRNYGPYLLFGGAGHRTGERPWTSKYEQLRKEAKKLFPESREVTCWSAQDCITPDQIPYIGRYSRSKPDWYIAVGFQKWGMSTAMAASLILRDLICQRGSAYGDVFSPQRFPAENIPFILKEGGHSIKGLTRQLLQRPKETAKDIKPGHGGVVLWKGKKTGIYKDEKGEIYAVDIRCPHLGCQLEWNQDEKSWDCPCHGSRFDYLGRLMNGPAQTDLRVF